MRKFRVNAIVVLLMVVFLPAQAQTISDLQRGFERPPDDARIMMRWWWFGPSVTKAQLEREMRLMKEGGIGGFEVQPVYPLLPDDPALGIKNLPFLSDEFIDALRFVSAKSRELGLRMDLTLGSGWPFGGPQNKEYRGRAGGQPNSPLQVHDSAPSLWFRSPTPRAAASGTPAGKGVVRALGP